MFLRSTLIAFFLGYVKTAPIELCEISKEWGQHTYPVRDNCTVQDLKLKANKFTIGGSSHGGYMASNLFTMFNDNIDGVSINIGSGPCANAAIGEQQIGHIFTCERSPLRHLTGGIKGKPVHIYAGANDTIVPLHLSQQTANFFENHYADVKKLWIHDFGHIFPNNVQSNDFYNPPKSCAPTKPYDAGLNQCGYNMAHEVFSHLYKKDLVSDVNYQDSGKFYLVDQKSFSPKDAFLAEQGYLYVPNSCLQEECAFHVEFHGANSTLIYWNDTMVRGLGYMELAAQNNIIILFPNSDDMYWGHGWRSGFVQSERHPQIYGIANLIKGLFDRDLLNQGVQKQQSTHLTSMMMKAGETYLNFPTLNPIKFFIQRWFTAPQ